MNWLQTARQPSSDKMGQPKRKYEEEATPFELDPKVSLKQLMLSGALRDWRAPNFTPSVLRNTVGKERDSYAN